MARAPQQRVRPEHADAERREALLELRAERLRRGGETRRRLAQRLAQHEKAADAVTRLDCRQLLAHDRIGAIDEP